MGLPLLALLAALATGRPAGPGATALPTVAGGLAQDEQAFRDAHLEPTGPAALEFFRDRTNPPDSRQIGVLVRDLGAADDATRRRAAGGLVRAGAAAVPQLRPAANGVENDGAAARARQCLELIDGRGGARLPRAAARLAAATRPAGAAGVLLAYLPFADNDEVAGDVEEALAAVARPDGRPDPALLTGLADAVPARRAAAVTALCRDGSAEESSAARALLKDPAPAVRLRAALGLAGRNDAAAIPALIDLLAEAAPERRKEAEAFLIHLAGEWAIATPQGNDEVAARLRREAWSTWWRNVDGAALLNELRARTLTDPELDRVQTLIGQLADGSAEARETATAGLVEMGIRVAPLLRRAAADKGRTAEPAAACLEEIERGRPRPLPAAAGRLLALCRPAGTAEAVLAYLPCAESDEVAAWLGEVLSAAGFRDGKPLPALVDALADKVAIRRAAAAEALCGGKAVDQLPAVRQLLNDSDPGVRLRSALALAAARDPEAVPALIDLLAAHPDIEKAREVEDFLIRLADDKAPTAALATDQPGRVKVRDDWAAWWSEHRGNIDLARLEATPRPLGYLLSVEQNPTRGAGGRVSELGRDGKIRWQFNGLMGPCDAHVLPGDRVLVAEQNANRVTERDFTGKVLWERSVAMPFQCQRLRNGNTFVAGRNLILEVDAKGKEVFSLHRPDHLIAARRFRDGQTAFFTQQGDYVRLDASGKEVRSFHVGSPAIAAFTSADVLPGDRVLVAIQHQNRVAEYDSGGRPVWEATLTLPGNPTRLPNGNTLVASVNTPRVTELSRTGKVVVEWKDLPVRPWRVDQR
jgi:hypothetical protein